MKLEVVVIPVSDVDIAKRFYTNLGWRFDADFVSGDHELVSPRPSSTAIAAPTPPARWGTPATDSPISTPVRAAIKVSSLHSPR
jgi:catechol 2,3-dioxygenase-like lactoylglutathione lyase family enzyme